MKEKKCTPGLVLYEIRNAVGNPMTLFFGIIFPIIMSVFMTKAFAPQIPGAILQTVNTSMVISFSLICPMSIILLGYSITYSQELEKEIPLRMRLFGYPAKSIMAAKAIAQLIFLTFALLIYAVADTLLIDIQKPAFRSLLCLIGCLYLLAVIFFILAHAIAGILRKFGPTYAITMIIYFLSMMVCGMMGIKVEQFPKTLRTIAGILPMTYISNDFIDFWQGGSYNFMPLFQSFLFLGAVSGILLLFALHKDKRIINA